MSKSICWVAPLLTIGCFNALSSAALIDNGTFTTDTDTELDWLDLSESVGRTLEFESVEFGIGGDFEGWRHATFDELFNFWSNAGLTIGVDIVEETDFATAVTFVQKWGFTQGDQTTGIAFSYFSVIDGNEQSLANADIYFIDGWAGTAIFQQPQGEGGGKPFVGHALVRNTIPEPTTAFFFLCLATAAIARRRNRVFGV